MSTAVEPLRFTFEVGCPAEHAFATWTSRISAWWPRDHSVSGDPGFEVVLEPRVGGRLLERCPDGREFPWGEITVCEPPRRLAYLWHFRRDPGEATEVEIQFVDQGDGTTLVEIEHTGWERLGDEAETWRTRNERAWSTLFPYFEEAATQ